MYRNLIRFVIKPNIIPKCVVNEINSPCSRHISVSAPCWKKRKSIEERAVENNGRRVIRYAPKAGSHVVGIWRNMTVREVAGVLEKDIDHILEALEFADKTSGTDYKADTVIHNSQIVRDVVKICGCRFKIVPRPEDEERPEESRDAVPAPPAAADRLRPRPPVVCVMGHVDHGKTTLLDALRDTALVDLEHGGITQHIGAFEVRLESGELVTFLDTPGHAAFSSMRQRGAQATDLVALVVAADDGPLDQTAETVRMAREADVPILVVVNKIDKPAANVEETLRGLARLGVVCEQLGGDTQAVAVSALKRQNLPALVEALALQAQLLELRADPGGYVEGVVLEARLDARSGKQATVLVQRGTLRRGAVLVAGAAWGRARLLLGAGGEPLGDVGPGRAAAVTGWRALPNAGDVVLELRDERRAHVVMKWRHAALMKEKQAEAEPHVRASAEQQRAQHSAALKERRLAGRRRQRRDGPREKELQPDRGPRLNVVVKGDVDGTLEAVLELLDTYADPRVKLAVVQCGVGPVTPSDVEAAAAFNAVVYALNAGAPPAVLEEAKRRGVAVRAHSVIYRLAENVRAELSARLPAVRAEEALGEARVLAVFAVGAGRRRVPVAGARVLKGELRRTERFKLLRDGDVIYDGTLESMKHLKDEVSSVKCDTECGLRLSGAEPRPGDVVLCYRLVDEPQACRWDPGF